MAAKLCPQCGQPMEEGVLWKCPEYWKPIERKHLIPSVEWGDVPLAAKESAKDYLLLRVPNSYLCRTCRFVLTPLPKSKKE